MPKLSDWCNANKLSVNLKKSKFMIFRPRQKRQTLDINLEINHCAIERVKETVFLGVILDEEFSWKPYIANVARKISKSIDVIYKASFCLPTSSLLTLYYSLVYPYLVYCVSVWGSTQSSNLKRILLLQKKVVRWMFGSAFDAHTEPIFKQLKILKLCDIFRFQVGKIMFLFKKGRLPIAFNNLFTIGSQLHSYNRRNSSSFYTFLAKQTLDNLQYEFKDHDYLIHWIQKFAMLLIFLFLSLN